MNIVTIGPMQERTGDAMLISDGFQIHFEDTGSPVPVLFVPGSYSTPAAWRGVGALLAGFLSSS
jgi:pimeloyl-ACP methyl ester carboxylesterase